MVKTQLKQFLKAITLIQDEKEAWAFCRDLMTEQEIEEFAARLEVANQLNKNLSQRKVSALTGVSIATVTRVNQWLKRGNNGYKLILKRLSHHPQ